MKGKASNDEKQKEIILFSINARTDACMLGKAKARQSQGKQRQRGIKHRGSSARPPVRRLGGGGGGVQFVRRDGMKIKIKVKPPSFFSKKGIREKN